MVALTDARAEWPPDWSRWAALIERLEQLGAGAVFLDVELTTPRGDPEGIASLSELMRQRRLPGAMPVLLADNGRFQVLREPRVDCPEWGDLPLGEADRRARSGLALDLACDASGLAFFDWPREKDHRAYPLFALHAPHPGDGRLARASLSPLPATLLARLSCQVDVPVRPAWCSRPGGVDWLAPAAPVIDALHHHDPDHAHHELPPSVRPIWALAGPDALIRPGSNCRDYGEPGIWRRLGLVGLVFMQEMIGAHLPAALIDLEGGAAETPAGAEAAALRRPCFVPRTLAGGRGSLVAEPGSPEDEEALRAQLRGRLVLVGDARVGAQDIVPSPLHGVVPGVMLHAAVLLNLLDHGENTPRVSTKLMGVETGKLRDWSVKLLIVLSTFALLRFFVLYLKPATARKGWLQGRLHGLAGTRAMAALGYGTGHDAGPAGRACGILLRLLVGTAFMAVMVGGFLAWHLSIGASLAILAGGCCLAWLLFARCLPALARSAPDRQCGLAGMIAVFRLLVFTLTVTVLLGLAQIGYPSASPLLVLLVALSIVLPVLDHGLLDEAAHSPDPEGAAS